jgi:DNA-3-methyladenine glycosylase I
MVKSSLPFTLENWVKLFKRSFVFTGREIVNEFLMSTGCLPGAQTPDCPIYGSVLAMQPAWNSKGNAILEN